MLWVGIPAKAAPSGSGFSLLFLGLSLEIFARVKGSSMWVRVILRLSLRYLFCAISLWHLWANCIFTSPSLDLQLARRLPARVQGYPWRLAYSTLEHGTSLKTLYRKSASLDSPVLLVIKDMDNQVRLVPLTENTFWWRFSNLYTSRETSIRTLHYPDFTIRRILPHTLHQSLLVFPCWSIWKEIPVYFILFHPYILWNASLEENGAYFQIQSHIGIFFLCSPYDRKQ